MTNAQQRQAAKRLRAAYEALQRTLDDETLAWLNGEGTYADKQAGKALEAVYYLANEARNRAEGKY